MNDINNTPDIKEQTSFRSISHRAFTVKNNKILMSNLNKKRYIQDEDKIKTYPTVLIISNSQNISKMKKYPKTSKK